MAEQSDEVVLNGEMLQQVIKFNYLGMESSYNVVLGGRGEPSSGVRWRFWGFRGSLKKKVMLSVEAKMGILEGTLVPAVRHEE